MYALYFILVAVLCCVMMSHTVANEMRRHVSCPCVVSLLLPFMGWGLGPSSLGTFWKLLQGFLSQASQSIRGHLGFQPWRGCSGDGQPPAQGVPSHLHSCADWGSASSPSSVLSSEWPPAFQVAAVLLVCCGPAGTGVGRR